MKGYIISFICLLIFPCKVFASGYGVFTQGASGLGQANAVVAHPTGPSSLYFNPALLNDVPGQQIEIGTTALYADRKIDLDSGGTVDAESNWDFPSTLYYTQEINDRLTAGLGVYFPFGLSSDWDDSYEGRYISTSAEMFTTNINPAVSLKLNDKFSLAAGVDVLYLDTTIKRNINQNAIVTLNTLLNTGVFVDYKLNDIEQKFEGDGWGVGYNLGLLYKFNDIVSFGATYRSHIDVTIDGKASFDGVNPLLAAQFPETDGDAEIRLPQQVTAGVAVKPSDKFVIEVGVRWEDWESTDELRVELDQSVLGQSEDALPRDWNSTWTYNIGGQYRLNDLVAINAGYLYGKDAVPDSTFEPLIPDTDAHLFTVGTDLNYGAWTISAAFGYEYHEDRDKENNKYYDTAGSVLATAINGMPTYVNTANGAYESDIYLVGLSLGYKF